MILVQMKLVQLKLVQMIVTHLINVSIIEYYKQFMTKMSIKRPERF